MNIKINPIIKKDIKVSSRSMRICWSILGYEGILVLAYLCALLFIQEESRYFYSDNIYSMLTSIFPVVAITQLVIVALIVPIMTASSISGEKERQTFDIMLTTCMSPFSIVFGKVISAMMRVLLYVVASTPIMALAFVLGGLKWSALFGFLLVVLLFSFFAGSIGIFCSSVCKKSISAVILSFGFYFIIFTCTFIPMLIWIFITFNYSNVWNFGGGSESIGETPLFLLINPIVFIEEFFTRAIGGSSLLNSLSGSSGIGILSDWLMKGPRWLVVSAVFILLLSFLFLFGASRRINPLLGLKAPAKPSKRTAGATPNM